MPGVKIKTSTKAGPSNTAAAPTSRAFIAGVTERGTLVPKSVRSIVEFEREFGGLQSYSANMYRTAQVFFEEGGAELVVARAVGTTPTVATKTLVDRTGGTPLNTMRLDAANAGAWGANLTYTITAGALADSVTFAGYLNGERVTYITNKTSVADLVTALSSDIYFRAADLGAASAYPLRLPALQSNIPLVGGNDDRATVNAAKVAAALNLAGSAYGAGAVAAPGYNATSIGALLIAHAKANRRVAILAGDVGSIPSDLTTMASNLTADGDYAGIFGPWLTVPDGSGTAQVPPEGFVLAARARAMNTEGFWQAAAGGRSKARYVSGTVSTFDGAVIDALADGRVSGITRLASDTVLYGWRSLSTNTEQFALLDSRDFLNTVAEDIERLLQQFVFETIDGTGQLIARIKGALVGYLQPIEDAGGISAKYNAAGDEISGAYRVDVSVLNETTITTTVVLRKSGVAETIEVSIVKAAFNATI